MRLCILKKLPVGKIYDYRINKNNKVEIDVVIDKAYAKFVKKRFTLWNISGINANISPSGLNLNVESLNAVVQGRFLLTLQLTAQKQMKIVISRSIPI